MGEGVFRWKVRGDGEFFVGFIGVQARGVSMVSDDAEHVLGVEVVFRERGEFMREQSACIVGDGGHDAGECGGQGAPFIGVVRESKSHEERA